MALRFWLNRPTIGCEAPEATYWIYPTVDEDEICRVREDLHTSTYFEDYSDYYDDEDDDEEDDDGEGEEVENFDWEVNDEGFIEISTIFNSDIYRTVERARQTIGDRRPNRKGHWADADRLEWGVMPRSETPRNGWISTRGDWWRKYMADGNAIMRKRHGVSDRFYWWKDTVYDTEDADDCKQLWAQLLQDGAHKKMQDIRLIHRYYKAVDMI